MTLSKDSEITLDIWKSDMESVDGLDIVIDEPYLPIIIILSLQQPAWKP